MCIVYFQILITDSCTKFTFSILLTLLKVNLQHSLIVDIFQDSVFLHEKKSFMLFEYTHKTVSNPFDLQSAVLFKSLLYGLSYIHFKTSTFLSSLLLLISSFQITS